MHYLSVCYVFVFVFLLLFRIKNRTPWSKLKVKLAVLQFSHLGAIKVDRGTCVFISWKINMDSSKKEPAPNTTHSPSVKHKLKNKTKTMVEIKPIIVIGCKLPSVIPVRIIIIITTIIPRIRTWFLVLDPVTLTPPSQRSLLFSLGNKVIFLWSYGS